MSAAMTEIEQPELVYAPGRLYAVGEGVLSEVLHVVDEGVRPIQLNGWVWFAHCGALVQPSCSPREGWPYCPKCWDLS